MDLVPCVDVHARQTSPNGGMEFPTGTTRTPSFVGSTATITSGGSETKMSAPMADAKEQVAAGMPGVTAPRFFHVNETSTTAGGSQTLRLSAGGLATIP